MVAAALQFSTLRLYSPCPSSSYSTHSSWPVCQSQRGSLHLPCQSHGIQTALSYLDHLMPPYHSCGIKSAQFLPLARPHSAVSEVLSQLSLSLGDLETHCHSPSIQQLSYSLCRGFALPSYSHGQLAAQSGSLFGLVTPCHSCGHSISRHPFNNSW